MTAINRTWRGAQNRIQTVINGLMDGLTCIINEWDNHTEKGVTKK